VAGRAWRWCYRHSGSCLRRCKILRYALSLAPLSASLLASSLSGDEASS